MHLDCHKVQLSKRNTTTQQVLPQASKGRPNKKNRLQQFRHCLDAWSSTQKERNEASPLSWVMLWIHDSRSSGPLPGRKRNPVQGHAVPQGPLITALGDTPLCGSTHQGGHRDTDEWTKGRQCPPGLPRPGPLFASGGPVHAAAAGRRHLLPRDGARPAGILSRHPQLGELPSRQCCAVCVEAWHHLPWA